MSIEENKATFCMDCAVERNDHEGVAQKCIQTRAGRSRRYAVGGERDMLASTGGHAGTLLAFR